jgi:hypothetical protein
MFYEADQIRKATVWYRLLDKSPIFFPQSLVKFDETLAKDTMTMFFDLFLEITPPDIPVEGYV